MVCGPAVHLPGRSQKTRLTAEDKAARCHWPSADVRGAGPAKVCTARQRGGQGYLANYSARCSVAAAALLDQGFVPRHTETDAILYPSATCESSEQTKPSFMTHQKYVSVGDSVLITSIMVFVVCYILVSGVNIWGIQSLCISL